MICSSDVPAAQVDMDDIWMVLINRNERCGLQIRQQHRVIKMLCWRNQCSIAHPVMQYRSGWVGSEGDSKLSLILQGACFRLGQIWILSLDMIQFTEYGWYAELHHPSNFTATQWTEVHRIWMICSPGLYLMQCSSVFDEDVCSYAPLGGNCNCALLGGKCAIVCNCKQLCNSGCQMFNWSPLVYNYVQLHNCAPLQIWGAIVYMYAMMCALSAPLGGNANQNWH